MWLSVSRKNTHYTGTSLAPAEASCVPGMATLRFGRFGEPVLDDCGEPSVVFVASGTTTDTGRCCDWGGAVSIGGGEAPGGLDDCESSAASDLGLQMHAHNWGNWQHHGSPQEQQRRSACAAPNKRKAYSANTMQAHHVRKSQTTATMM